MLGNKDFGIFEEELKLKTAKKGLNFLPPDVWYRTENPTMNHGHSLKDYVYEYFNKYSNYWIAQLTTTSIQSW